MHWLCIVALFAAFVGAEHVFDEDDLYYLLGVDRSASTAEIKRAYRRLAVTVHPDKAGGDAEKFKQITRAYEVLGDETKRNVYDFGGMEAVEAEERGGQGKGGGFEDVFSAFFGGGRGEKSKRAKLEIPLYVTLEELYMGKAVKAQGFRQGKCQHCRGTGAHTKKDIKPCSTCGGQGFTVKMHQIAPGMYQQVQAQCRSCGGQGKTIGKKCGFCKGGKVGNSGYAYSMYVEKGMSDGQQFTFKHALDEGADQMGPDAVFVLHQVPHAMFRRDGNNLHVTLELSLKESLLGFEKSIVHLDGREVVLSRKDRITDPDFIQKLKGEGFPVFGSPGDFGDLLVKYQVKFPNALSQKQIDTLRQLGIDQGTTSTRAILFDQNGKPCFIAQKELTQIVRQPGWCEHDPNEIYASVEYVISEVLGRVSGEKNCRSLSEYIGCIGIANQRETVLAWDKVTGEPLHNALVWLDTRTLDLVDKYRPLCESYRSITGLPVNTYFSALKIRWLLDHVPAVHAALKDERCCFGTIDCWLVFKMTEHRVHVTDVTNASRYNLFDLTTLTWSEKICDIYNIPISSLPRVVSSAEVVGSYKDVPISAMMGDQQAALLGQGCLSKGQAKITYGTGAFLLVNAGEQLTPCKPSLLTTIAFQLGPDAPVLFAREAAISSAGRAVDWLKQIGLVASNSELEELAASVDSSAGVSLVPAFSGLFCPQWRLDARACLVGLSLATQRSHICRAALEGVALQVEAVVRELLDLRLEAPLQADGGMTNNTLFMQIQANVLNHAVAAGDFHEATAWGAALAAGIAVGILDRSKIAEYRSNQGERRVFEPHMSEHDRFNLVEKFNDAVPRSLNLSQFEH